MTISDDEKCALDALRKKGTLREQTLRTCRRCGITNQTLILLERGKDAELRSIRNTFNWLSKPTKRFPAMLEAMPMRLASKNGRPQQAYLLTEFGRRILNRLDPTTRVRVNNPRDGKDLYHRFAQLNVLIRALQNGWEAEVEKVIPYHSGEVRCDLVVSRPEGNLYIEIEQELTRSNIERAREKFRNWQAYALSEDFVPDMLFVFNLPDTKLAPTLAIWREALGCVHDYRLDVRYIPSGALEGRSLDIALQSCSVWMDPIIRVDESGGAAFETTGQTAAPDSWLPDASKLLPEFERRLDIYSDARRSSDRMKAFLELMVCIYDASYEGRNSDVFKYNELPVKSLWLLRRYLNLPQNQVMYEELKQAMIWVKSRGSMGLIMLRDTLCGILWDTFLEHHHLAMGGNLRVTLDVPDYVNHNSTFEVKVTFWEKSDDMKSEEYCKALAWTMTAFLWYPKILETGTQPWKKNKKMKGAKQNAPETD
ncbi:MAG: hypothetical protein MUO77_13660 [Anaerolineales bacterium]|nr:hypothetical protein [Anaerolineales bacterium]